MGRRLLSDAPPGDRVSVCLAGACSVHCVGAPLLVGILPLVGMTLADPRLEWVLLAMSLITSAATLATGCLRSHRHLDAMAPFAAGAACLLGVRLRADTESALAQTLVVAGATLLIASHAFNIRLCRRSGNARCARIDLPVQEMS